MIKQAIIKRVDALETQTKKKHIPNLILISFNEDYKSWIAKELYGHCAKFVKIHDPDDYKAPEGFSGTIIIEGVLED